MSGETDAQPSPLTPDLVNVMLTQRIKAMERHFESRLTTELHRLQQQFEAQEKAKDKAFEAQATAMETARNAAQRALDERAGTLDREFHERLVQYRHEVTTAFQSSDRAISKAETANEKRFESVNEFRSQLNDQAGTFLTRTEYHANHSALVSKFEDEAKRNQERFLEVAKRLDINQGKSSGIGASWGVLATGIGLFLAILGIVAFFNAGR